MKHARTFTPIDLGTWSRGEIFDYFSQMAHITVFWRRRDSSRHPTPIRPPASRGCPLNTSPSAPMKTSPTTSPRWRRASSGREAARSVCRCPSPATTPPRTAGTWASFWTHCKQRQISLRSFWRYEMEIKKASVGSGELVYCTFGRSTAATTST